MTNTTNTAADSVTAILFEHEDGRYAINPNTTGDPAWHRLGPVDVSAIAAAPAQQVAPDGGSIVRLVEEKIAAMSPSEVAAFMTARAALAAPKAEPAAPDITDAYAGAQEDIAIWKKRALEAEALNHRFIADINGPTFVGEPTTSDDAFIAREFYESQDDSLLLCASDLQHSAIYDNHIEMQSCIRAVADRITALASVIEGVERAALATPAQAATAKQSPHPEYDKGFSDGWNRCEARQAAAPASQPFAYEFSRSNGDGTHSEHIERGRLQEVAPGRWEHSGLPRGALADKPIKALYTTPQTQPAAVLASGPVAWLHDCAALLTNDVELWIDACPHCGKPRNAPQPVERQPLTDEQIEAQPVAWALQWPADSRLNLSTVFDTQIEATDYLKRCSDGVVVVPLYAAPQPAVQAAPVDATVQEDAERWQFLAEYLVGPRTDLDDEIVGCDSVQKMARVLDATIAAQKETND